jgi:hypothetical protein
VTENQLQADRWLLEYIDDKASGLTPWEIEFVESLTAWLERDRVLTPKQREQANHIRDRRCP